MSSGTRCASNAVSRLHRKAEHVHEPHRRLGTGRRGWGRLLCPVHFFNSTFTTKGTSGSPHANRSSCLSVSGHYTSAGCFLAVQMNSEDRGDEHISHHIVSFYFLFLLFGMILLFKMTPECSAEAFSVYKKAAHRKRVCSVSFIQARVSALLTLSEFSVNEQTGDIPRSVFKEKQTSKVIR